MKPHPATAESTPASTARKRPIPAADAKAMVLFNPKAGGVTEADRDKLIEAIKAAGISHYAMIGAEMLTPGVLKRAKNFDVVIVLGGDGTARAVAQMIPRGAPPLILLPGGTMNMLPRALYGELAWPEALAAALERGVVKKLAGGLANGERFFVAAIFGAPTLLARARESIREGKPLQAIRRTRHFLKRAFSRNLRARPGRARMHKAEAVGVLCPSFIGAIDGADLEWVRLDAKHLLELARVSLRAMSEGWRSDSAVEISRCREGDIVSPGIIPAVLDGEPRTFVSRVRITYDANGPRVIALEPEGT